MYNNGNRVGIGTTNPSFGFDVKTGDDDNVSARFRGNIQVNQFDATNRAYAFETTYTYDSSGNKIYRTKLDTSDLIPRIIILPGSGAFSLGRSFKESQISLDIFLCKKPPRI